MQRLSPPLLSGRCRIIQQHFDTVSANCVRKHNSYPDNLCNFYALVGFIGERSYRILSDVPGFPCHRAVALYRNEVSKKFNLGPGSFAFEREK
jgi:hypothetical protein